MTGSIKSQQSKHKLKTCARVFSVSAFGLALILSLYVTCQAAKLTNSQIGYIQANIQKSKNMSDQSAQLHGNAQDNTNISSSNSQKTNLPGFRQSADVYSEAKLKFLEARKHFDDAWIAMQYGLEHGVPTAAEEGLKLHNIGIQHYN